MDLHFITENTRTVIYNTPRLSGLVADLSLGKYSLRYILEKEADYLGVNLNNDDIQALLDEITTLRQTVLDTQTALKG